MLPSITPHHTTHYTTVEWSAAQHYTTPHFIVGTSNIFVKIVRRLLNIQVILEYIGCATLKRDVEEGKLVS